MRKPYRYKPVTEHQGLLSWREPVLLSCRAEESRDGQAFLILAMDGIDVLAACGLSMEDAVQVSRLDLLNGVRRLVLAVREKDAAVFAIIGFWAAPHELMPSGETAGELSALEENAEVPIPIHRITRGPQERMASGMEQEAAHIVSGFLNGAEFNLDRSRIEALFESLP